MKTIVVNMLRQVVLMLIIGINVMCAQKNSVTEKPITPEEFRTGSPYFVISPKDDLNIESLPLESTNANVVISGVIADVNITQTYRNRGKSTIEAVYVFPASTRAAVYAMKMMIGERVIVAKIEEKNKARSDYEAAKQEGKTASLLEQQRPNVFTMNVANILPGDVIKVTLSYTELLVPEKGVYEFIYPTVVGPRYSNGTETSNGTEAWVTNPYTSEGTAPAYSFGLNLKIHSGIPLNDVRCLSHNVNIKYDSKSKAEIVLKESEKDKGNKDFILQYRLSGQEIQSGIILHKGEKENFFLAMIQPPQVVTRDQIPPREYIFIVDVSGSMFGFPLDISKNLMRNLLTNLRPADKFNIILFAGGSQILAPQSIPVTKESISKAVAWVDSQRGGGGTELLPALQKALAMPASEGYSRSFVIATDGYVSIEKQAFDLIRNNLNHANFFPFGIGSSVNRHLIEGMAHVGMGIPFIIEKTEGADAAANRFRSYIENPVLTGITVRYEGFEAYDVEPLSVPDVLAERPVIIYGKWRGSATGTITLQGDGGKGKYIQQIKVASGAESLDNVALQYLWARERIKILDDYSAAGQDQEHIDLITRLGLQYNLLTNYTSFIAIDSENRNNNGSSTTVRQPLPLPEGVSNYAVGSGQANYSVSPSHKSSRGYQNKQESISSACVEMSADYLVDEKEELLFIVVEEVPEYMGGTKELNSFIKKNIVYPSNAKAKGITGKVYIQFVVDANGNVKDVIVARSVDPELDKEAVRLVMLTSGKWKPAKQNGVNVATTYTLPIEFVL